MTPQQHVAMLMTEHSHRQRQRSAMGRATGMGGLGADSIMSAIFEAGRRQVRQARFRSQLSPTVSVDPNQQTPRTAAQGGFSETMLRAVKPALDLETTGGWITIAPWGEPQTNYFPLVVVGGCVLGALGIGLMIRGMRRR